MTLSMFSYYCPFTWVHFLLHCKLFEARDSSAISVFLMFVTAPCLSPVPSITAWQEKEHSSQLSICREVCVDGTYRLTTKKKHSLPHIQFSWSLLPKSNNIFVQHRFLKLWSYFFCKSNANLSLLSLRVANINLALSCDLQVESACFLFATFVISIIILTA